MSWRTNASANPAASASSTARSAWCGASSSTSTPSGSSHPGAAATMASIASRPVGPLTSAPTGSRCSSGGRSGYSASDTYGGFDTISRSFPRSSSGRASNHAPCAIRTRAANRPAPARFARATTSASSLTSVAHTSASGSSAASASASAPVPVPRSATAKAVAAPAQGSGGPRRAPSRSTSSIASSAVVSVSGRGIRTRGSTSRSRPRNDHEPSTYCSGSPAIRRSTMAVDARRRDLRRELGAVHEELAGVEPGRLLDDPPRLRLGRDDAGLGQGALGEVEQIAPGRHAADSPSSCPATLRGGELVDDLVELPGEDLVEGVHGQPDAVVGDALLLVVVRPDLLGASAALHLVAAGRRQLLGLALLLGLQQPGPEDAQRLVLVLELALLVLARDDEARGRVRDAHRRVGGVDGLAAGAARPEHVDHEVVGIDLDVDLVGLGQDGDGRGTGVDPPLALGRGHPLHPVRPALVLQSRPRVLARARRT